MIRPGSQEYVLHQDSRPCSQIKEFCPDGLLDDYLMVSMLAVSTDSIHCLSPYTRLTYPNYALPADDLESFQGKRREGVVEMRFPPDPSPIGHNNGDPIPHLN